jgi:hypothetical protein
VRAFLLNRAKRIGVGAIKELVYTLREEVVRPKAIFRGEKYEGEPDWICYACRPARAYAYDTGDALPAWKGKVFLVLVDGEQIIQRVLWVKADPSNPDLPEDHGARFGERLI